MADASLNPLLTRVKFPGKVFQLPSKGLFYQPGILAETVKNGEVQVKPMSAIMELKIKTADLLLSNKIVEELCAECVPEILKPSALINKDVDALFLFLAIVTYGSRKEVKAIHNCDKYQIVPPPTKKLPDGRVVNAQPELLSYSVDLDQLAARPENEALNNRELLYTCKLPNEQVVTLRPVTFNDDVALMELLFKHAEVEREGRPLSSKDQEERMIRDAMSVIESVTSDNVTVTDRKQIEEWFRVISSEYHSLIIDAANRASDWGYRYVVPLTCKDCGEAFEYTLELNPVNFSNG